jgi:nitroreductase
MTHLTRRLFAGFAGAAAMAAAPAPSVKTQLSADATAFLSVFKKRQTVRKYKMDDVPDEHVRLIVEAAGRAPTCMNQQPWKFLVVRDRTKIERMRKLTLDQLEERYKEFLTKNPNLAEEERATRRKQAIEMTEGYFSAPVYVVVLVDTQSSCASYGMKHDGPMAAGYLMLAARALGYGTVYLTDGVPDSISREVLAIPERWHRICMTPIGVPDGWPEPKPKKPVNEIIAYETI